MNEKDINSTIYDFRKILKTDIHKAQAILVSVANMHKGQKTTPPTTCFNALKLDGIFQVHVVNLNLFTTKPLDIYFIPDTGEELAKSCANSFSRAVFGLTRAETIWVLTRWQRRIHDHMRDVNKKSLLNLLSVLPADSLLKIPGVNHVLRNALSAPVQELTINHLYKDDLTEHDLYYSSEDLILMLLRDLQKYRKVTFTAPEAKQLYRETSQTIKLVEAKIEQQKKLKELLH